MSNYACEKCGCVDNTALTRYWGRHYEGGLALCSACDPKIGRWHGLFPRRPPDLAIVEIGPGRILRERGSPESKGGGGKEGEGR